MPSDSPGALWFEGTCVRDANALIPVGTKEQFYKPYGLNQERHKTAVVKLRGVKTLKQRECCIKEIFFTAGWPQGAGGYYIVNLFLHMLSQNSTPWKLRESKTRQSH